MRDWKTSVKVAFNERSDSINASMVTNVISKEAAERMIFQTPALSFEELAALDQIEELWGKLRFYISHDPHRWMGSVRRVLGARAIQGSNSIEGYNVSVEDALAAIEGDEPTDAAENDWNAVTGYRRALTYVLQLARDEHFRYTPQLLRSLHFMMTEHSLLDASPGLWRPGPIWVRNEASGEVVYAAPDADEVPELIQELIDQLDEALGDGPPIVRAAMAHLNLVMIHPYRDGNGRMSRCLQTLVLAREGILPKEFSSIEEYLGANTDSYYRILASVGGGQWSPERNALPWVRYCLEAHYIQAASVLRRVQESEQMWREIDDLRAKHRLPDRSMAALFEAGLGLRVRNSSYRAALENWEEQISNQAATSDLRAMVDAGLLSQLGRKRGTFYVADQPLRAIRASLRDGRVALTAASLFAVAA